LGASLLLLVETDIIHPHFAGGGCGFVDCSGEAGLAYGEVEDDVERVVEDPLLVRWQAGRRDDEEGLGGIVAVELHAVFGPGHAVGVKLAVVDATAVWEGECPANALAAAVAGAVDGGGGGSGAVLLDPFDDVLLAAVGPVGGFYIVAEEPEGGPEAGTGFHAQAGFHAAIENGVFLLRVQARGAPALAVMDGLEDEVAFAVFVEIGIFGVAGALVVIGLAVPLDFVVASRSPTFDEVPVGAGGQGVGGAVELVAPDELPFGFGVGCGESQEQGEGCGESDHGCPSVVRRVFARLPDF